MNYSKGDLIEGVDVYDKPVKGMINGFIKSFGFATVEIKGKCYGTTVNLTDGSISKIIDKK